MQQHGYVGCQYRFLGDLFIVWTKNRQHAHIHQPKLLLTSFIPVLYLAHMRKSAIWVTSEILHHVVA